PSKKLSSESYRSGAAPTARRRGRCFAETDFIKVYPRPDEGSGDSAWALAAHRSDSTSGRDSIAALRCIRDRTKAAAIRLGHWPRTGATPPLAAIASLH